MRLLVADKKMTQIAVEHIGFPEKSLKQMGVEAESVIELVLFIRQYENIYYQHVHKMLPRNLWDQWRSSMLFTFSDERVREILSISRIGFSKEFRTFVEEDIYREIDSIVP